MKVILAEKPSVAQDIANVVGAKSRRQGYFEGNDYIVTFAFGHLIKIADPEKMDSKWGKPWKLENLPMLPTTWKYCVDSKVKEQFKIIKNFFLDKATTSIICATDAGREGEHIFRLIYELTNCQKPVYRLWISSLTPEAIQAGFNKLKPSREFDNLANAAKARAHADWIVGLNFTRAYTIINSQLCTVGRVQTPTLALITKRQIEIDNFKPQIFYEIIATFEPGFNAYYQTPNDRLETRLVDKNQALAILNEIMPCPNGTVKSVALIEKKTKPPLLFDLLNLQKEANKRFGYTAKETLDIAQNLYEKYKLLSYPRTESRHLSTDMLAELPKILTTLLKTATISVNALEAFTTIGINADTVTLDQIRPSLTKNYVDNTKLTDHHAIIPTHKYPTNDLPLKESNIYKLVTTRFLSIFLPPEIRNETTVIIGVTEHNFRARGIVITDPGWTVLTHNQDKDKDESTDIQILPKLEPKQIIIKRASNLKEGKTTPPKPYDDASLLSAMKNAGNVIDDEDLASYMKQNGLGTPATRAAIIERLIQSGYIERKTKTLIPTAKGLLLIENVHHDLKDVSLTASWEELLGQIMDGKLNLTSFEEAIGSFVTNIIPEIAKQETQIPMVTTNGIGSCPLCKTGEVRPSPKAYGCSRWKQGCKFTIWREQYGKKLSDLQITELFNKHQTKVIKGFKKKDGSGNYEAKLVLTDDFKVRLNFDK